MIGDGALSPDADTMKRFFDLILSLTALVLLAPLLLVVSLLISAYDGKSPFFRGRRVGRGGDEFRMLKFRSMRLGSAGAQSTKSDDPRITPVGAFVRRYKLDELPQLWNIVLGQMSFVGPRPNVASEVAMYSEVERRLLTVRPGITDFASIIFSDEGEILRGSNDPDLDYNLLIRPWKSRLGLHYIDRSSLRIDLALIHLTALAIVDRASALERAASLLSRTGAPPDLVEIARRRLPLVRALPPGVQRPAAC